MYLYVIAYNPSLPNTGEIINKYWDLLALSEKQSVKYVFQHKPILAFKRPQNLGDILTHSKMNFSQNPTGSVSACKNAGALIVKLSMNQIISVVPVSVKHFCINRTLTVHLKMLFI